MPSQGDNPEPQNESEFIWSYMISSDMRRLMDQIAHSALGNRATHDLVDDFRDVIIESVVTRKKDLDWAQENIEQPFDEAKRSRIVKDLRNYFARATRNLSIDYLRSARIKTTSTFSELASPQSDEDWADILDIQGGSILGQEKLPTPEEAALQKERNDYVIAWIATLKSNAQPIIFCRFMLHMSFPDVAKACNNIPTTTAKTIYQRNVQELIDCLRNNIGKPLPENALANLNPSIIPLYKEYFGEDLSEQINKARLAVAIDTDLMPKQKRTRRTAIGQSHVLDALLQNTSLTPGEIASHIEGLNQSDISAIEQGEISLPLMEKVIRFLIALPEERQPSLIGIRQYVEMGMPESGAKVALLKHIQKTVQLKAGQMLLQGRKKVHKFQIDIAHALNIDQGQVSRMELGKIPIIRSSLGFLLRELIHPKEHAQGISMGEAKTFSHLVDDTIDFSWLEDKIHREEWEYINHPIRDSGWCKKQLLQWCKKQLAAGQSNRKTLGHILAMLRESRDFFQSEVESRLGLRKIMLSNLESGHMNFPYSLIAPVVNLYQPFPEVTERIILLAIPTLNTSDKAKQWVHTLVRKNILADNSFNVLENSEFLAFFPVRNQFGEVLRAVRETTSLIQSDFASELNISESTIMHTEAGDRLTIDDSDLAKLTERFPQYKNILERTYKLSKEAREKGHPTASNDSSEIEKTHYRPPYLREILERNERGGKSPDFP